jgi:hypothetical protein
VKVSQAKRIVLPKIETWNLSVRFGHGLAEKNAESAKKSRKTRNAACKKTISEPCDLNRKNINNVDIKHIKYRIAFMMMGWYIIRGQEHLHQSIY